MRAKRTRLPYPVTSAAKRGTRRRKHLRRLAVFILLIFAVTASDRRLIPPAQAQIPLIYIVNSNGDAADNNLTDNVCSTGSLMGAIPVAECTLRAAIEQANAHAGADTINFALLTNVSGFAVIAPQSPLPAATDALTIDGTSQPGYITGSPRVVLEGSRAGAGTDGLKITAGNSTVRALVINQFRSDGIELATRGGNAVEGCFIGTTGDGSAAAPNFENGIFINNVSGNRIDGMTPDAGRNIISGNGCNTCADADGIEMRGNGATGNLVRGNYIGTNPAGTAASGNAGNGVLIASGATGNQIGGTTQATRNVISGNSSDGVEINAASGNTIAGNYIGTDESGTLDRGNGADGVRLASGAANNTIGGMLSAPVAPGTAPGNVISGNDSNGVQIINAASSGNRLQGNLIGLQAGGSAALGNESNGVLVSASGNTIGGASASARNVISGHNAAITSDGVDIQTESGDNNVVAGNYIGTDISGTADFGNRGDGVRISGGDNNIIGGAASAPGVAPGNLISGNDSDGVEFSGNATGVNSANAAPNRVQGNIIGLQAGGQSARANSANGVLINGALNSIVGGIGAGERNVISSNGAHGISANSTGTSTVQGNYIGTDAQGSADFGNLLSGVSVNGGATIIGRAFAGARNVISGNGSEGISISGGAGHLVQGNFIGTDKDGNAAIPNSLQGIRINASPANTIGAAAEEARNLISGNSAAGIEILGSALAGTNIENNFIGTKADGASALGNGGDGISIQSGASNNRIGAATSGEGNTIAFNGGDGVRIASGTGNLIRHNSIFSNSGLGIELDPEGVTPNDTTLPTPDSDTGANNLQNFPNITSATTAGNVLTGELDSTPDTTFTIDFYSSAAPDASAHGEGQTHLGEMTVKTGPDGHISFNLNITKLLTQGHFVTATATDPGDNTSEFSHARVVVSPPPIEVSVSDATAAEPASSSADSHMLFTVTLSAAPTTQPVSVAFATAETGSAVEGSDYTHTSGTLTFNAGQRVRIISVPILFDAVNEGSETFHITLGNLSNAIARRSQATATIGDTSLPGTVLISELRTSGPGGTADDFVEVYNNSNAPLTVVDSTTQGIGSDPQAGWAIVKMGADCDGAPEIVGIIPEGTRIPARGHYLFVGAGYSLSAHAAGDKELLAEVEDDRNIAVFSTTTPSNLGTATRLDAVGFGMNKGSNCDLLREGETIAAASGSTAEYSYVRKQTVRTGGIPADANNNASDFQLVVTEQAASVGSYQQPLLGAPGPEHLLSPTERNRSFSVTLLDANAPSGSPPNRERDVTSDPANNSTLGTITVRRKFTNNSTDTIRRLRFRIVDMTTFNSPQFHPGLLQSDVRALSSQATNEVFLTDGTKVTVLGTTLETPPRQPRGGGLNAALAAGSPEGGALMLPSPGLAPGATINLQFMLGVEKKGYFRFLVNIEALP